MLCKILEANKTDNLLFVFFNGFGSDYKYWDNLLPYFSEYNKILLSENYFYYPEDYNLLDIRNFFRNKTLIGVGHSQGYHKLCALNEKYDFFNLNKIVSIEGFSNYLGKSEPLTSIRKFYLNFMKYSYKLAPKLTLSNFMKMCGAPIPTLPANLNKKLLMQDLQLLYGSIKSPDIPHLILTSYDDWVIPYKIIEDNFRRLRDVRITYTLGASHLLGMKFPQYVSKEIQHFATS